MLKEKVFFRDGLPVNVFVAEVQECPIHFHDELEIVYVLAGDVMLKNGYCTYHLREGDVFILNDREIHSFYPTDGHNLVVFFQISLEFFSAFYADFNNNFFVTDMKNKNDERLEALKMMILRIVSEVLKQEEEYEGKIIEYTKQVLNRLLEDFLYFSLEGDKFINETGTKSKKISAERLRRITNYMYENHSRKLTLAEIASNEHLNIYYLSHVIKESAGMNFQELLNFIRVEESEKLLLGTNKKISAVASESGFSAVRYYIKYFERWFGVHPAQYRREYASKVHSIESPARYIQIDYEEIKRTISEKMPEAYMQFFSEPALYSKPVCIDLGEIKKNGEAYRLSFHLRCQGHDADAGANELADQIKILGQKMIFDLQENVITNDETIN